MVMEVLFSQKIASGMSGWFCYEPLHVFVCMGLN